MSEQKTTEANAKTWFYLRRLLVALVVFTLVFAIRSTLYLGEGDFTTAFCSARALSAGLQPYADCAIPLYYDEIMAPYPMTTVLAVSPLAWFVDGAGVLFALISALMAWALTKDGEWWRLLAFLSAPYYNAFLWTQWSPLIVAVALMPSLLPLALVKPQLAVPVVLMRFTIRRAIACAVFVAVTFAVRPTWVSEWLAYTGGYDGYIPLLAPFGAVILLGLLRWKEEAARWILLYALMPLRWWYDLLPLWITLRTRRDMLILTGFSWLGYALFPIFQRDKILVYHTVTIFTVFIPALYFVLRPLLKRLPEFLQALARPSNSDD